MKKVGRTATKPAPLPEAHPDQAQIAVDMAQLRINGVAERQAHEAGIFDLGRQVGAIQMANVQTDFLAVARIKLFEEIKESNKYKDLAVIGADGVLATARNLDEFCGVVFGVGYAKMLDASKDLNALGEKGYESAKRIGLTRKQLRLIRSLPDAQRTAVAEAIEAEGKSEVVAIIEDLAAQLAQANEDKAAASEQAAEDKDLLAGKDQRINKLEKQLKRIDNAPPDDQLKLVLDETTARALTAITYVRGDLNLAFSKLAGFERAGANSHRHLMAGWLGDLEREIAILRADYFLPQTVVTP